MRGRDDRAAANQRADNPLYLARLRAVAECEGRLEPQSAGRDRLLDEYTALGSPETWDLIRVDYLKSEWPPSKLN